jgi:hypothetical protein
MLLGRHRRRRACRDGQVHLEGRPGRASGARGTAGLVGRGDAGATGRAARGRPGSRLLDVVGYVAVAADLRRRRPAPAPGNRGAHLRRPAHPGRPAAAAGRGGTRRCRRVPVHLLRDDGRLAAQARCRRLPRHRGPLLALWLSADGARAARLSTPATAAGEASDAADASPLGARPVSWSCSFTAVFRCTP